MTDLTQNWTPINTMINSLVGITASATDIENSITKLSNLNVYNVLDYGAKGNNSNDDTSSVQSAINAAGSTGGIVYFPSGTYRYTALTVPYSGVILQGSGAGTLLLKTGATGNGVTLGVSGTLKVGPSIRDIVLSPLVNQSSGALVYNIDTLQSIIDNVILVSRSGYTPFNGIQIENSATAQNLNQCTKINNCYISGCTNGAIAGGLLANDTTRMPQDTYITNSELDSCAYGLYFGNFGGLFVNNCGIGGSSTSGIYLNPGASQSCNDFFFNNSWVDTCTLGVNIAGTGTISDVIISNSVIQSCTHQGILINNANAALCGINNNLINYNGYDGINLTAAGGGININDNRCSSNGHGGSTYSEIYVGANITDFNIIGNNINSWSNAKYGINVATGASDYYEIVDNKVRGAVTTNIVDGGSGTNKKIKSNIGYVNENASTATITNGTASIAVTHGLAATPTKIQVVGSTSDTASLYVDTIGATQFTIHATGNVGGNRTVYWKAEV